MDSLTDLVDEIVESLVSLRIVKDDDREKTFLTIENSIKNSIADFDVDIVFNR